MWLYRHYAADYYKLVALFFILLLSETVDDTAASNKSSSVSQRNRMEISGRQEGHAAYKTEWWGAGMVICLGQGADFCMAQLIPLQYIQIGFTFLVPAHPGSPGQRVLWLLFCADRE